MHFFTQSFHFHEYQILIVLTTVQWLGIDLTRKKHVRNNEIWFLSVKPLFDLHFNDALLSNELCNTQHFDEFLSLRTLFPFRSV